MRNRKRHGFKLLLALVVTTQVAACGNLLAAVKPIEPEVLVEQIQKQEAPFILDVRSTREYVEGHVPGAVNIDFRQLQRRIGEIPIQKNQKIVIYCETGVRARVAEKILQNAGFTNVLSLEGHMSQWRQSGRPTVKGDQPFDQATKASVPVTGLIVKTSPHSVDKTVDRLTKTLKSKGIKVFATIDHSQNATKAGLTLPETTLVLFGNPKLGTPLMQCQRSTAIDLPQKVLVWKEGKAVKVAYNDPKYLAERHQHNDCGKGVSQKIAGALNKFTDAAIAVETSARN